MAQDRVAQDDRSQDDGSQEQVSEDGAAGGTVVISGSVYLVGEARGLLLRGESGQ
jgi:hypothetical protein